VAFLAPRKFSYIRSGGRSESQHDPTDDERSAVDVDPVLVVVTVAASLEIEPVEG